MIRRFLHQAQLARGLGSLRRFAYLLATAIGGHVIRMVPPHVIGEAHCDEACAVLKESVATLA